MAELYLIPTDRVMAVWERAKPLVEKSVPYSDYLLQIDDLEDGLAIGSKQLWVIVDETGEEMMAAGVTEIINDDTCFVWGFGGKNMSEWFDTHQRLEAWAKEVGCKAVSFFGRQGWERVMRPSGYKRRMVVLRKEL